MDRPIYRQLADSIEGLIRAGHLCHGEKLPATRELAKQLNLNRTTVSAAYSALETAGLLEGHVGRGSFVAAGGASHPNGFDWKSALRTPENGAPGVQHQFPINFANSRPAQSEFPVSEFRQLAKQVIESEQAGEVLQLGSPHGYAPLRRYLLSEASADGTLHNGDDLIITSGCQQAFDLLSRLFPSGERAVVLEDPVYHGLLQVFSRGSSSQILPAPMGPAGVDLSTVESIFERHKPLLMVITPSFQNPTGSTMTLENRRRLLDLATRHGVLLIENDIYAPLRYRGSALPCLKQVDQSGHTVLLRSYSKISFPGLRVGWVLGPRPLIARLAEAKQASDLHSDQLGQAILLRFAQSGELQRHLDRTRRRGAERLHAIEHACSEFLPEGTLWTRPDGGMSLWVELPGPLTSEKLLPRVQEQGVDFLPGSYFSKHLRHERALRISFGALTPEQIRQGIKLIGETAREMLSVSVNLENFEPAAALV